MTSKIDEIFGRKKYRGVQLKDDGQFQSELKIPGTQDNLYLGKFNLFSCAARAYDIGARVLHGPACDLNYPYENVLEGKADDWATTMRFRIVDNKEKPAKQEMSGHAKSYAGWRYLEKKDPPGIANPIKTYLERKRAAAPAVEKKSKKGRKNQAADQGPSADQPSAPNIAGSFSEDDGAANLRPSTDQMAGSSEDATLPDVQNYEPTAINPVLLCEDGTLKPNSLNYNYNGRDKSEQLNSRPPKLIRKADKSTELASTSENAMELGDGTARDVTDPVIGKNLLPNHLLWSCRESGGQHDLWVDEHVNYNYYCESCVINN